ncbi:uncharacterized protein YdhG (YjbR/CyaY superfamily) [Mucilaginibacter rubeus]|uniref:KAP family P-loop NTPase fold protein n=1 Tax=Mucilaginibacter rubeus TaxID=2027860 RepID=UPI0033928B8F
MWADNETSEDLLGFKVHADLLIDVINDETVLPVTIGVFGDWGSGKSSILNIIKNEYDKEVHKDTLCIYFNGWTFEGYDDAKAALLNAILKELEDNKKLSAEIKDSVKQKAKKLWKSIDWMRGAGMIMKNIALPAVSAYFTGGVSLIPFFAQKLTEFGIDSKEHLIEKLKSKEGAEFFESLKKSSEESEDKTQVVAQFRKDFEDLLKETRFKKLVVIIDDLDRCTPDRIIDNLEAVKLFLNVANTAFVIGADPRIVKHAIEYRYKEKQAIGSAPGDNIVNDYLEKLIQIPYNLPKLSDSEVETYISLLICKRELSIEGFKKVHDFFIDFRQRDRYSVCGFEAIKDSIQSEERDKVLKNLATISGLIPIITQTLSGNPRQIKRFLNTMTLRQRLANVANISDFDIAILTKLMVLEYSNLDMGLFKQLFDWQIGQKGVSEEIKKLEDAVKTGKDDKDITTAIEKIGDEYKAWGNMRILRWLKTEPFLADIDLSDYFWLSRDKIASTIPGTSLIPTVVKSLYKKLSADSLTSTVTNKIITTEYAALAPYEKQFFLSFAYQMLISNPKIKRGYDIFHSLIETNQEYAEAFYAKSLESVPSEEILPAIGEALKRYADRPMLKEIIEKKFKAGKSTAAAKAFNTK